MFKDAWRKKVRNISYSVSEEDESESLFLNFFLSMRSIVEPRYGGWGKTMLPAAAAALVRGRASRSRGFPRLPGFRVRRFLKCGVRSHPWWAFPFADREFVCYSRMTGWISDR